MTWCTRSSPPVALLKLMFLWTWDGYLMESLDFPKRCQATCSISCVTWDGSWANAGEMCFILSWFGVHQYILHSWSDIKVLFVLWQSSWVFYGVQSRKSRFLMCLIGNTELLWMQCKGIGPGLSPSGKSYCFSRVAVGTWGVFSIIGGDFHSKLVFVQWRLDSCLTIMDTSGIKTRLGRTIRTLLEVSRETKGHFLVGTVILGFLTIFQKCRASLTFESLNFTSLSKCQRDVRPVPRWGGGLGLSVGSLQGIQTSFHLVIWKMSLHLRLCREIQPFFESGHLRVHFT